MRTILENKGNKNAFVYCENKNKRRGAKLKASFSVYDYAPREALVGSFGPAFYIGRTESHLPLPGELRAKVRIRVYPK